MPDCAPYIDSNYGRITVHDSSERPTGADRYAGKHIYESNTGREYVYILGTGWVCTYSPLVSYDPVLIGMDIGVGVGAGAGSNSLWWGYAGGAVAVTGFIQFSDTGQTFPATTIGIILPPEVLLTVPNLNFVAIGRTNMGIGATQYVGTVWVQPSADRVRFVVQLTSGTYESAVATSTTVPGTWATGSYIAYNFVCPATITV